MNINTTISALPLLSLLALIIFTLVYIFLIRKCKISLKSSFFCVLSLIILLFSVTLFSMIYTEKNKIIQETIQLNNDIFKFDKFNGFYSSFLLLTIFLSLVFCYNKFHLQKIKKDSYFLVKLLMLCFSGLMTIYSNNILTLYLGIELISLTALSFFQIIATKYVFIKIKTYAILIVSSFLIIISFLILYINTNTITYQKLGLFLNLNTINDATKNFIIGLFMIGIAMKFFSIQILFWFKNKFCQAIEFYLFLITTAVQISLMTSLANYLIEVPLLRTKSLQTALQIIIISFILIGTVNALKKNEVELKLRNLMIVRTGYLLLIFIATQQFSLALEALEFNLICTFLSNLIIYSLFYLLNNDHIKVAKINYQGLYFINKPACIFFTIALLSLAGIPLTIGFFNKFVLTTFIVTTENILLTTIIIISLVFNLYICFQIIIKLFEHSLENIKQKKIYYNLPIFKKINSTHIMIIVSTLLIIFLGIFPQILTQMINFTQL